MILAGPIFPGFIDLAQANQFVYSYRRERAIEIPTVRKKNLSSIGSSEGVSYTVKNECQGGEDPGRTD